jgi:hypothetical protein
MDHQKVEELTRMLEEGAPNTADHAEAVRLLRWREREHARDLEEAYGILNYSDEETLQGAANEVVRRLEAAEARIAELEANERARVLSERRIAWRTYAAAGMRYAVDCTATNVTREADRLLALEEERFGPFSARGCFLQVRLATDDLG